MSISGTVSGYLKIGGVKMTKKNGNRVVLCISYEALLDLLEIRGAEVLSIAINEYRDYLYIKLKSTEDDDPEWLGGPLKMYKMVEGQDYMSQTVYRE